MPEGRVIVCTHQTNEYTAVRSKLRRVVNLGCGQKTEYMTLNYGQRKEFQIVAFGLFSEVEQVNGISELDLIVTACVLDG